MLSKVLASLLVVLLVLNTEAYKIGVGISDITGPTGIGFYGYASDKQIGKGIYFRLFSRAYIVEQANKRMIYVNTDLWSAQESVKEGVINELRKKYGNLYSYENLCLSSTHQHSGPGGYSFGALYNIATFGFSSVSYNIIVKGVVNSIVEAHNNMVQGKIYYNEGKLYKANINRSPGSYLKNPRSERRKYRDGNTDKTMRILKFVDSKNKPLGVIAWFSVHPTSLSSSNKLISGDNKGYASYMFEKNINSKLYHGYQPGHNKFIASFPEAPSGDASANTRGAFCPNGKRCDFTGHCNGNAVKCLGKGPTDDRMKNLRIIGGKQYKKALELFNSASIEVTGPIDFAHNFVKLSSVKIRRKYMLRRRSGKLCVPAMGPSFFGGTSDGVSGMNVIQGKQKVPVFIKLFTSLVSKPKKSQKKCQRPKKAVLNLNLKKPYRWIPKYSPLQIFKIGQIVIFSVSTELTTMAARRLSNSLKKTLIQNRIIGRNGKVIINTVANGYTHYTTTPEEFTNFRYEGASTLFGQYQLNAYHQEFDSLIHSMAHNRKPKVKTYQLQKETKNLRKFSVHTGLKKFRKIGKTFKKLFKIFRKKGRKFGTMKQKPKKTYTIGETVKVKFHGNKLKSGFKHFSTLMNVERQVGFGHWKMIKTDSHIETTIYETKKKGKYIITVTWKITSDTSPGTYRINYFGMNKKRKQHAHSNDFKVVK